MDIKIVIALPRCEGSCVIYNLNSIEFEKSKYSHPISIQNCEIYIIPNPMALIKNTILERHWW